LADQRWFAGKARTITQVSFVAAAELPGEPSVGVLAVIEVAYTSGDAERYLLPLTNAEVPQDGLQQIDYCAALFEIIANGQSLTASVGDAGQVESPCCGEFVGVPSNQFAALVGSSDDRQPIRCGSSDQSNSAVVFGEQLFLKVFRKLEPGLNPDHEIAQFLTNRTSFTRLPRVAGAIEFRPYQGEAITLAVLQAWVPNQGNAWEAMLADVGRVLTGGAFRDDYVQRLGQRTAELHLALASVGDDPAFAPEPMTRDDVQSLVARLRQGASESLAAIGQFTRRDDAASDAISRLLQLGPAAVEQLAARLQTISLAAKTRIHGDYHLGQVLCQGDDFIILDFEGEPARPLAERRAKDCPMRDVAGMLRSFGYAAHVGLMQHAGDEPATFGQQQSAATWRKQAEHQFWQGYQTTAGGAAFLPTDEHATQTLLDFYLAEKALYEVRYEANNRPDWVLVPVTGLLEILSPAV
jgi:maltose alpha-D-glucosyltransferase/alpha-amylase